MTKKIIIRSIIGKVALEHSRITRNELLDLEQVLLYKVSWSEIMEKLFYDGNLTRTNISNFIGEHDFDVRTLTIVVKGFNDYKKSEMI